MIVLWNVLRSIPRSSFDLCVFWELLGTSRRLRGWLQIFNNWEDSSQQIRSSWVNRGSFQCGRRNSNVLWTSTCSKWSKNFSREYCHYRWWYPICMLSSSTILHRCFLVRSTSYFCQWGMLYLFLCQLILYIKTPAHCTSLTSSHCPKLWYFSNSKNTKLAWLSLWLLIKCPLLFRGKKAPRR